MRNTILLLLFALSLNAQRNVSLAIYQDVKLLTIGDGYYETGTINLIARIKMQGHQQKYGYMIVYPEFEYAQIEGNYKRYSLNVGYTFNKLFLRNVETSLQGGYGWIDRYDRTTFSASANGEIAYNISDKIKINLLAQFTHRTDLKLLYNDNVIRFSGFLGLEYNL